MSTPSDQWLRRREVVRNLMPSIMIDSAGLRYYRLAKRYEILVRGRNLRPAAAPPSVTVHGIAATDLRFSSNGVELRGTLPSLPPEHDLLIDLGFDWKQFVMSSRVTDVPSFRYLIEWLFEAKHYLFHRLRHSLTRNRGE